MVTYKGVSRQLRTHQSRLVHLLYSCLVRVTSALWPPPLRVRPAVKRLPLHDSAAVASPPATPGRCEVQREGDLGTSDLRIRRVVDSLVRRSGLKPGDGIEGLKQL
jgi:hypothetical protein